MNFFSIATATFLLTFTLSSTYGQKLNKKLSGYCEEFITEFDQIPDERKEVLKAFGDYLYDKQLTNEPTKIIVICTHNSRRSHIGQLWLYAAAAWYGIDDLDVFSGGTEATAFHPNAVDALDRAGFQLRKTNNNENPTYEVRMFRSRANQAGMLMFSKKYDHSLNPKDNFAAIMVCSEADASCPVVPGAEERFSIPFDDPRYVLMELLPRNLDTMKLFARLEEKCFLP